MKNYVKTKMNQTKKAKAELSQSDSLSSGYVELVKHRRMLNLPLAILFVFFGMFMYFLGCFSSASLYALSDQSSVLVTSTVPEAPSVANTGQQADNDDQANDDKNESWFNISVPIYITVFVGAVAFWIGYLFNRNFRSVK